MHNETKQQVRQMMAGLVDAPYPLLGAPVLSIAASWWMVPGGRHFIIQLELLHNAVQAIMFSTIARDGSGPLKASFLTMLLLEDTAAYRQKHYSVFSGEASVTLYRIFDVVDLTATRMAAMMANFIGLNEIVFADYLRAPSIDTEWAARDSA